MAGAKANMRRLLVVAFGAHTCSSQLSEEMCPYRTELPAGSFLETRPWSFMRAIDVMTRPSAQGQGPTSAPFDPIGPNPDSSSTEGKGSGPFKQGTVRALFFTWTSTFQLEDERGDAVARIVNPAAPWDTTQEVYNCEDVKVGEIVSKLSWWDSFWTTPPREIRDQDGKHVANLVPNSDEDGYLASSEHMLILKNLQGQPLIAMTNPRKGWKIGPFGSRWEAQIEYFVSGPQVPMPAAAPEFLTLAFTNELAGNKNFGPIWQVVMVLVFLVGLPCLLCAACGFICAPGNAKSEGEDAEGGDAKDVPEMSKLLGADGEEKVVPGNGSMFACCSRRQVAVQQNPMSSQSIRDNFASLHSSMKGQMSTMSGSMQDGAKKGWATASNSASAGWSNFQTNMGARPS